jgi:hypothetical protein
MIWSLFRVAMIRRGPLLAALLTVSCGSSEDREFGGDCGSMTDNFAVTERRESGTCPASTEPFTIGVVTDPDGNAEIVFQEFGLACNGTVNGCTIKGNCVVSAGTPPETAGSVALELVIRPDGLSGSYSVTLDRGHPLVPDGCSSRFVLSGTRQ